MKGFFEHQYLSFKQSHLSNLIALAHIDDKLDDAEIDFFFKVGRKYGLKDQQITKLINNPEKKVAEMPDSHEAKISQLFDLAGMMLADGLIETVELEFCKNIAQQFGFKPQIIQELVEYVIKYQYPQEDWPEFLVNTKKYVIPPL